MGRELIDKYESDDVGGSGVEIWTAPEIPSGQTWHLVRFGAMALNAAIVALQIRTSTSPDEWTTIRAVASPGCAEFTINRDFVGDGVARFRVVRQEKSGATQPIAYWIEGYRVT